MKNPAVKFGLLRYLLIAALFGFTLLVLRADGARTVDWQLIRDCLPAESLSEMSEGGVNTLRRNFNLDGEGIASWMLYTADSFMDVSELLILQSPDASALEDALAKVNQRLSERKESFRGYGTNQTELLERAVIWQKGEYLFYAVGEDAPKWEEAFLSCVR